MRKDTLLTFKSTKMDTDKAGRDRLVLYMNKEEADAYLSSLSEAVENSGEHSVKLVFHTGEKTTNDGARKFLSTFGFVSVADGAGKPQPTSGRKFAPKGPSKETKEAAAQLLNKRAE